MLRISGPELIYVFTLDDKHIVLFGDEHNDTLGKCKKCTKNCLRIDAFLERLQPNSDVFVESPWVMQSNKYKVSHHPATRTDDFLRLVRKTFSRNLYTHKQTATTRFHFTDIRLEPNVFILDELSYIYHLNSEEDKYYFLNTIYDLTDANVLFKYADACIFSKRFAKDITDILGKDYVVKQALTSLPGKKRKNIHRIAKQIYKLPIGEQLFMYDYHKRKMLSMREQDYVKEYTHNRRIVLEEDKITGPYVARVHQFLFSMLVHLMDMYHLARMLHYMKKSNVIVSYTGSQHTHAYMEFFKTYYNIKMVHENDKSHQNVDMSKKRCVDIPLDIASLILQQ